MVFIRWSLPIFLFVVLSPAFAQQTSGGLDELLQSLERQDAIIRRMQVLLAEQNARQDGIEQSQPPLDQGGAETVRFHLAWRFVLPKEPASCGLWHPGARGFEEVHQALHWFAGQRQEIKQQTKK